MAAESIDSLVTKELRTEKFGIGLTPVARGASIEAAPAGGVGAAAGGWSSAGNRDVAIAAINAIIARLVAVGIIAPE